MSHSGPFQFLVSKGRDAVKRWIVNIFGALYHRQQHGNQNVYGRRTGRCSCPRTHRSVRNGAPVSRLYRLYAEAALITATSEISSVTAPEARAAVRKGTLMFHAAVRRKQLRSIGNDSLARPPERLVAETDGAGCAGRGNRPRSLYTTLGVDRLGCWCRCCCKIRSLN
jgi:hypothetical protein